MSRDVMSDLRALLESETRPLSLDEVMQRLGGEHEQPAVEHMLEHFRIEGMATRSVDGRWGWRAGANGREARNGN